MTWWGRPVDVQVMPDGALLVSDDTAGAIYRITYSGVANAGSDDKRTCPSRLSRGCLLRPMRIEPRSTRRARVAQAERIGAHAPHEPSGFA